MFDALCQKCGESAVQREHKRCPGRPIATIVYDVCQCCGAVREATPRVWGAENRLFHKSRGMHRHTKLAINQG